MGDSITIRRTYKYRLYTSKRDKRLHQQINVAGLVWNHALALQKRYYRLTGKYIPDSRMKAHISRLRMKIERYGFWRQLGSQAVQDVLERVDKAYRRFFDRIAKRPPKFKTVKRYSSFTLKQAGWKLVTYNESQRRGRGVIQMGGVAYKFVQHRPMQGDIKTVTVKRDRLHRLWLCFSVLETMALPDDISTSRVGGFDFGLRCFLTDEQGRRWMSPELLKQALGRVRTLSRSVSRKQVGSANRKAAGRLLARTHCRVADQRRDFHFKLAHALCDQYDRLCFEDLDLRGMKARWGRKVSDLGFAQFAGVLEFVAKKCGKRVSYIPRFERTTGRCSNCQHDQRIALRDRTFECVACGLVLDRDHNAARNIVRVGASTHTARGVVRPDSSGSAVDGSSPRL